MNDRFKFRCFNPEDKTMHYTDFVITATGFTSRLEAMNDNDRIFYIDNENLDMDKKLIVMQCTGLKDNNGKLIFEGDIVKEGNWRGIIKFGEYKPCKPKQRREIGYGFYVEWYYKNSEKFTRDFELRQDFLYWKNNEVIGNIYENPELLENNS